MHSIKELFDKAVGMGEGDKLVVPCENAEEAESIRVNLFRYRREYRKVVGDSEASKISISRGEYIPYEGKDLPTVVLEKQRPLLGAFIVKSDGSITQIQASEELDRIVSSMIADSIPREEIFDSLTARYGIQPVADSINRVMTKIGTSE